ncbi:glutathione S-transferase [Yoonia sediminilitoris]|uniref:Glutathione S-transferase n=1 Tax=Yoonia sediminilitoris TaxID=1286148 RepID=A0A2T6KH69_9RHOB|nr:glutathione S-transferase [Yoonia sediminilitoris]PUB14858.1 glutathione S-transferase [Yoonia sediminilitoris]RCW95575.1 glutathione S-transferase [Yoonia sediminilitoris]
MTPMPILWSFRRCPYAMRARLAIRSSGVRVALREILLRDKPAAFLSTSPKGTVPVIDTGTQVIAESRDIMLWALAQSDPGGWCDMPDEGHELIDQNDGPFKQALDRTKYAVRYPDVDVSEERAKALVFLHDLNSRLNSQQFLMGSRRTLADMAILPFVRQFANTDRAWFDAQKMMPLSGWLDRFLVSDEFAAIMTKYTPWEPGQDGILFP